MASGRAASSVRPRRSRSSPRSDTSRSRDDSRRLHVLALAEATLDVLLGILLGQLLLALAEATLVELLGIGLGNLLLALAEATDLLILGKLLGVRLALGKAPL